MNNLYHYFCPFLLVTFFDSIKQATADTAEPILTRDSSYDVFSGILQRELLAYGV